MSVVSEASGNSSIDSDSWFGVGWGEVLGIWEGEFWVVLEESEGTVVCGG